MASSEFDSYLDFENNAIVHTSSEDSKSHPAASFLSSVQNAGLDHLTNVFYRLFVKDICDLTEIDSIDKSISTTTNSNSTTIPTLLFYKDHIVNKIEVIGLVTLVDTKEMKDSYAVDDGSGVIRCNVWKNYKQCHYNYNGKTFKDNSKLSLPLSLQKKLGIIQSLDCRGEDYKTCDLGDVVRVRGRVVMFNGQKEIDVIGIATLNDPCLEIERILELPALYSKQYDRNISLPTSFIEDSAGNNVTTSTSVENLSRVIHSYLEGHDINVSVFDCKDVLSWPDVKAVFDNFKDNRNNPAIVMMTKIKEVLANLSMKYGIVCERQEKNNDDNLKCLYEVIKPDCQLCHVVTKIIREFNTFNSNSDEGCHVRYIIDTLRNSTEYKSIGLKALQKVIDYLEYDSLIISVGIDRVIVI